jgi:hypothetical protein
MEIASVGVVPYLKIGQRVFTDTANLIKLVTFDTGTGNFSTFRTHNGTAGYEVPAGKQLRIQAIVFNPLGTGNVGMKLCYGDTDVGISVGAVAPTNAVYLGGSSGANARVINGAAGIAMSLEIGVLDFVVPAGKFAALQMFVNSGTAYAFGYLESV